MAHIEPSYRIRQPKLLWLFLPIVLYIYPHVNERAVPEH